MLCIRCHEPVGAEAACLYGPLNRYGVLLRFSSYLCPKCYDDVVQYMKRHLNAHIYKQHE